MLINMDYDLTKGMTIGTFEDGGAQNLAYAKSLKVLKDIGYTPIAGFEANMMGIECLCCRLGSKQNEESGGVVSKSNALKYQ